MIGSRIRMGTKRVLQTNLEIFSEFSTNVYDEKL